MWHCCTNSIDKIPWVSEKIIGDFFFNRIHWKTLKTTLRLFFDKLPEIKKGFLAKIEKCIRAQGVFVSFFCTQFQNKFVWAYLRPEEVFNKKKLSKDSLPDEFLKDLKSFLIEPIVFFSKIWNLTKIKIFLIFLILWFFTQMGVLHNNKYEEKEIFRRASTQI